MNTDVFRLSRKESLFHLIFWSLLFASLIIGESATTKMFFDKGLSLLLLTVIAPIYLNAFVLIPKYLKRSKIVHYTLFLTLLLLGVNLVKALFMVAYLLSHGHEIIFIDELRKWVFRDFRFLDKFLFSGTMMILYISFGYRFIKDWFVNERVKQRLISDKLTMELALLKSQVNPHFLFNTLNNVYATAMEENAPNTADNIAKLGSLMRYGLHDAQVDFILLSKEIDYIGQYVDMQKLRVSKSDKINLDIQVTDDDFSSKKIAPMLLMPFIENAFKFGISTTRDSEIDISISCTEGILTMDVKNRVNNVSAVSGGVGLFNVKSRLNLLYPNKYILQYGRIDEMYKVNLKITL